MRLDGWCPSTQNLESGRKAGASTMIGHSAALTTSSDSDFISLDLFFRRILDTFNQGLDPYPPKIGHGQPGRCRANMELNRLPTNVLCAELPKMRQAQMRMQDTFSVL
jgi:hypothetical protein